MTKFFEEKISIKRKSRAAAKKLFAFVECKLHMLGHHFTYI